MAHVAVLLARLTLGGMWIVAALAKLASRESRSQAVEGLGFLHGRPAQALGLALPYMELILGLLLLTGEGIRAAAVISALLLTGFSVAMTVSLVQGRRVRCNCFGQLGTAYVSWASVVRNSALLVLAIVPWVVTSDYLALHRLLGGGALRGDEPPPIELPPLLLPWTGMVLGSVLAAAMWAAITAMARAAGGPAEDLPETQWLRRLIRVDAVQSPSAPTHGD